jgi:ribonuclease BN (tRNA processing enzyme)
MGKFEVVFLGTCGSVSYNNGNRTKYGTNSVCVVVKVGGETIIFDTGTGACGFAPLAESREPGDKPAHVFYSHYHADHLCGLIFIPHLYNPQKKFNFYGSGDIKSVLGNFLSPSLSPVNINMFGADLNFCKIEAGDVIGLSNDVTVKTCRLSHPGGAIGYRVEYLGKSFCCCMDSELADHIDDNNLQEFTQNADLLVLDSFFDDGKVIKGWGHSSWMECALWAKSVEAKRLALLHHDFKLTDKEISRFEEKAKEVFPETFAAADFMRVEL